MSFEVFQPSGEWPLLEHNGQETLRPTGQEAGRPAICFPGWDNGESTHHRNTFVANRHTNGQRVHHSLRRVIGFSGSLLAGTWRGTRKCYSILGASNTIHPHALQYFRGKHVLGFPDYDLAGINGMARWGKQLDGIAGTFRVFNYSGLVRDDSHPVNDLRDFLRVDGHQREDEEIRHPLASFIYPLLNKQNKEKGI